MPPKTAPKAAAAGDNRPVRPVADAPTTVGDGVRPAGRAAGGVGGGGTPSASARMFLPLAVMLFSLFMRNVVPVVTDRLQVLGFTRPKAHYTAISHIGDDIVRKIPNTRFCEDVHLHSSSGKLFTACEGPDSVADYNIRRSWFPPLTIFEASAEEVLARARGGLYVVDPNTFTSTRLTLQGFEDQPFVTHGIDLAVDPKDPKGSVYIHAVNHLPNTACFPLTDGGNKHCTPKAASRIEIFHHVIGTTSARHIRSVSHPSIVTPNDIYSLRPNEFFVTNDHRHREGLLRTYETLMPALLAGWSDTQHVKVDLESKRDASSGVTSETALTGLHNNNGLGRGHAADEVLIVDAAGGNMHIARVVPDVATKSIKLERDPMRDVHLNSTLDNPSYYRDPYRSNSINPDDGSIDDASGYVIAGLTRGCDLEKHAHDPASKDPVIVWHLQPRPAGGYKRKVLYQDDGSTISSASAAVLTPIDKRSSSGKKQAWLWVTGFWSENMVAVKVEL